MNCKERLTMHTPEGACLIINANNETDARQELMEKFKLACNKLAELEDKLENGTLIEVDENYHTHICKAKGLVNGFSIFARVVDETDDTVTIERYQEFGALKIRNIMISKEDFERYYKKISEVQCFLPKKKPKQG